MDGIAAMYTDDAVYSSHPFRPAETARSYVERAFGEEDLVQVWFGNPALHYEIWIRSRLATIEIGLHFEAEPLTNARLLAAFRARDRAVRRALGSDARIEDWDKGWARIWEPVSFERLDVALLAHVATRLAAYISVLEPILLDELPSDVAWSEPVSRAAGAQRNAAGTRARQRG